MDTCVDTLHKNFAYKTRIFSVIQDQPYNSNNIKIEINNNILVYHNFLDFLGSCAGGYNS